ncbi:MAG: PEP-CTERM sorting domain-containing protein [Cyanobacteria bacterium 0813]|nr:PEP-CTERM sorting domain-containing protein [Cyanobacteria bacterium 0813]
MSHKQMPRLGSAIASTILSLFSAVSLVGVDKAQAAVLTYNINGSTLSFFKVNNSSLTGIGVEEIAVSEGRFYDYTLGNYTVGGKEYYNLAEKRALFDQGVFRGLQASGGDDRIVEFIVPASEPGGPLDIKVDDRIFWRIETFRTGFTTWASLLDGYYEQYTTYNGGSPERTNRNFFRDIPVSYTLVDTEAEPVPEPLTAGGTALALAGLSWLKHKKKIAA